MIEDDSKIIGIASGYSLAEKEGFTKNVLSQFHKGAKGRTRMFSLVGKVLSRFLGPHGKEDYYLQSITVSNEMRGKGLGHRLMKHSVKIAVKKRCRTLLLGVASKNIKAIRSDTKFGMKIFSC